MATAAALLRHVQRAASGSYLPGLGGVWAASTRHVPGAASRRVGARGFAKDSSEYPPHMVFTMPELSPIMRQGIITKWHVPLTGVVKVNELLVDVVTEELTVREDGELVLEVESQEDGFLAKVFVPEGRAAGVHAPLAIVCEEAGDVGAFGDYTAEAAAAGDAGGGLHKFYWQAYTKKSLGKCSAGAGGRLEVGEGEVLGLRGGGGGGAPGKVAEPGQV